MLLSERAPITRRFFPRVVFPRDLFRLRYSVQFISAPGFEPVAHLVTYMVADSEICTFRRDVTKGIAVFTLEVITDSDTAT